MNRKVKSFKQSVFYRNTVQCQKLQQMFFEVQCLSLDTGPQSFCHSFIPLLMIRCSKSTQEVAVRVWQVATVVMATTQLILSQFKIFTVVNWERNKVFFLPKIVNVVNWWRYVILIVEVRFFRHSVDMTCRRGREYVIFYTAVVNGSGNPRRHICRSHSRLRTYRNDEHVSRQHRVMLL